MDSGEFLESQDRYNDRTLIAQFVEKSVLFPLILFIDHCLVTFLLVASSEYNNIVILPMFTY